MPRSLLTNAVQRYESECHTVQVTLCEIHGRDINRGKLFQIFLCTAISRPAHVHGSSPAVGAEGHILGNKSKAAGK